MNILEQKRKLLGHCYMGGGGGGSGGGGGNPGDTGRGGGGAHVGEGSGAAPRDGSAPPSGVVGGGSSNTGGDGGAADRAREAAESASREQAARDAAKAADARMAAEQAASDQAARDAQAAREQTAREARDAQMAAEQASREQAARDAQAAADKAAGEQAAREQTAREARDAQMAAEQASREQAAREQAAQAAVEAKAAQDAAAAEAARTPVGETARDTAPAPSAPSYAGNYGVSPDAPAGDASPASSEAAPAAPEAPAPVAEAPALSEADKEKQDNIARERAAAVAAKAEADRVAAAQDKAAASLNEAAVTNPNLGPLSDVSLSANQESALAKTEKVNALREQANEKLSSYYGKDANKYATTADKDPNAVVSVYKDLMGEVAYQKMMLGGGKQNPNGREVTVDVPTNSFVDVFGRPPTYAEAKALQAVGLGNITGVNANNLTATNVPVQGVEGLFTNEPGQTADGIVAVQDFKDFVGPLARAAAMFIPGASLAMTLNDLYTGKTTLGDITSNFALGLLAKHLGINVNVAKAVINGDFGGALASTMIGQLNPALAKELGINPRLASIIGKETGAYNALSKAFDNAFSGFDQSNWGSNTKDFANTINMGFQNLGITTGTGGKDGATGQALNLGFGADDAMDNYLGTNNGGPTLGTPTPPSTTPSITAPTKPVTTPTTPSITTPTTPIAPGASTTGTGASTINTQGNLFNPMGLTAPQTQQMTNAFPQLANVFYYGKDTGSKKQKLDENNQLVFEDADQGLASGGRIADNKDDAIDAYIRHIVEQSGGPMSHRELLAIVKGI